jgi:hypothetical protein
MNSFFKNNNDFLSSWGNSSKKAPQFKGRLEKCIVKETDLDTSSCLIEAKMCSFNSKRIAELYPHCQIVEGVLHAKSNRGEEYYCRHAWNHDLTKDIYFDKTINEDLKNNPDKDVTYSFEYYISCEYPKEEANWPRDGEAFNFSYDEIIEKLKHDNSSCLMRFLRHFPFIFCLFKAQ